MNRIPPQTVIEYTGEFPEYKGKRGVTVNDFMDTCAPEETPVIFYGEPAFEGVNTSDLKIIGPENAQASFEKCGAGQGENCCKFLIMGTKGPECERFGELRYQLILSQMTAQRTPVKMYPDCQSIEDHC